MSEWQDIDTMPIDRPVWVKSVSGIECLAKRSKLAIKEADGYGRPRRIPCFRLDNNSYGDISVIAWKEK